MDLWEESKLRNSLHGLAEKVPANVKSPRPVGPVGGSGLVTPGLAPVAGADELTRILVEAHLAAGGAEVVGVPIMKGAVLGSCSVDCHLADGFDRSGLVRHVVSLAPWGKLADKRSVM